MTMQPSNNNILNLIVEGMPVHDSNMERIGTVEAIHLGGQRREAADEGVSKSAAEDIRRAGEDVPRLPLSEAFQQDNMPRDVARDLLLSGYIQVSEGALKGRARSTSCPSASRGWKMDMLCWHRR
jgi:hypothetical protein